MASSNYVEGIIGDLYKRNLGSMAKIQVDEEGNWRALTTQLDSLAPEVRRAAYNALVQYGLKYKKALQYTIRQSGQNISPRWPALGEKYAARKAKKTSYGMWRWTGTVYRAIVVLPNDVTQTVHITVSNKITGSKNSRGEIMASQIATILEHGSLNHNVHRRPLFAPTWKGMGGNAALSGEVTEAIDKAAKNHMTKVK